MTYNLFGAQTFTLGTSISSTATTITLSSFTEPVTNVPYTMTLLNTSIVFATVAPKTTSSEFISFTGITQNADGTATLTGVTRGLAKKYPFAEDSAYKLPHAGQSLFIISDAPQVFNESPYKLNDETIAGNWTYSVTSPTIPTEISSQIHRAASIEYVNMIAVSGAPDSSTTVKGIGKVSVAPASPTSPIFVGDNDNRVSPVSLAAVTAGKVAALAGDNTSIAIGAGNTYVTQTGLQNLAETYAVATGSSNAYSATYSPAPTSLAMGQEFHFLANFTNTGTATLNVNGGGATGIRKLNGTTALIAGDIQSGQLVKVKFDGTFHQMLSPAGQNPVIIYKNGVTTYDLSTASGTQTIAHGLGVVPKYSRFTSFGAPGGLFFPISFGAYNGTTNSVIYKRSTNTGQTTGDSNSDTTNCIHLEPDNSAGGDKQVAAATWDATNITLTWTKSSSPTGIYQIMWEANS